MACNITINLGNNDNLFTIKTLPNYKLKFQWCFGGNNSYPPLFIYILLDYYDSSNDIPIATKRSCDFSLMHPIHNRIRKGFRRIINCMKDKTPTDFHLLRWKPSGTWRHLNNSNISRRMGCDILQLQLNDDAVDQFIDEFEAILKFLQLVDYKRGILHPSIAQWKSKNDIHISLYEYQ